MSQRANILFIMTDEQRYDCVAANGNPHIRTPNLDRLADESANLSNCFVQAPLCVPSRQSIFTGRYPHCHRNRVNYTPLDDRETLMQAYLRDAGYHTACVGKLHLYPPTRQFARSTGFDQVLLHDAAHTDKHSDYIAWLHSVSPQLPETYRDTDERGGGNPFRTLLPDELHETTWCGRQTRQVLAKLADLDKPFFLFSSYWKPHPPFELPDPWASMYDDVQIPTPQPLTSEQIEQYPLPVRKVITRTMPARYKPDIAKLQWMYRAYYGAVSQVDREVGLTLDALAQLGLDERTIVVFCSDHGDDMFDHNYRGKSLFFEASIHIPMMICWPGVIEGGRVDDLIEAGDLLATLFELAGVDLPQPNQGRSFSQRITGGNVGSSYSPRQYVFSENIIPDVITDESLQLNHPYICGRGVNGILHPDAKMVRSKRWKLNYYVGHGLELYDLENDPREIHNLAKTVDHAAVVAQMKDALMDWLITCDEAEQISPRWCDI